MDADLKKLKKLTEYCRKNKILSIKAAGIEIQFSPSAFTSDTPSLAASDSKEEAAPAFTEDDALFWSAPGADLPEEKGLQ